MLHLTFVQEIANFLESENFDLNNTTIIVPSQRSTLFIKKAIAQKLEFPIFSPTIISLDTWIKNSLNESIISGLPLQFLLFQAHCNMKTSLKKEVLPFAEFFQIAEQILGDFDDIERYMVSSNALFRNLKDIKELEAWQLDEAVMGSKQKDFLEFWEEMPILFNFFKLELSKSNVITGAIAFRKVAENISIVFEKNKQVKYLFAGFNAHSESELSIIDQLVKLGKAKVLVDGDSWYVNDALHEAGHFIRKTIAKLGKANVHGIRDNFRMSESKFFNFYNTSSVTAQAMVARDLLEKSSASELNSTLLLVGKDDLLGTVIRNLPRNIEKANITLGIELKNTALRTWLTSVFDLTRSYPKKSTGIYYKHLFSIMRHSFIQAMLGPIEKRVLNEFIEEKMKQNAAFISVADIEKRKKVPKSVIEVLNLFIDLETENYLPCIKSLLLSVNVFQEKLVDATVMFDQTLLVHLNKSLNEAISFFEKIPDNIDFGFDIFQQIMLQVCTKGSVAFYGNPTDGLQIMGILETRLLDFDTIIGLGMNEGQIPPQNRITSFIPFDLRSMFGLPNLRDKQSLFANHFYRLLQRGSNFHFVYTTDEEITGKNEKSRYLEQIKLELIPAFPQFNLKEEIISLPLPEANKGIKIILKDDSVMKLIGTYLAGGISASALQTYAKCPLNFFYEKLQKRRPIEISEVLESNDIGSIVHLVLDRLYRVHMESNLAIRPEDFDVMMLNFESTIQEAYLEITGMDFKTSLEGSRNLDVEAVRLMIMRFLKQEKEKIANEWEPRFIKMIEGKLTHQFDAGDEIGFIKVNGELDRVDSTGNGIEIYDYKTGVSPEKLKLIQVLSEIVSPKEDKAIQLMIYRYLYEKNNEHETAKAFLIFLLKGEGNFFASTEINDAQNNNEIVESIVTEMVLDLLNVDKPFTHKIGAKYCKFCL